LRTAFPERWVRFHSLPGSKRYPEYEADYRIVLERHNHVLGELVESQRNIILLTTGYSETTEPIRDEPELQSQDPNAKPWRSIPMHELNSEFADPTFWHVFASEREWRSGLLDHVVRLVADGVLANVMIVDPECRWLLHPYDGGMDVIAETPAARNRLRSSCSDWLSPDPDGL
jgi:hypothetical protein